MNQKLIRHVLQQARRVGKSQMIRDSVQDTVDRMTKMRDLPNPLFSDYQKVGSLFLPINSDGFKVTESIFWMNTPTQFFRREKVKPKVEVDFEVNLMEPLEGWKSWYWDSGSLKSNSGHCLWRPDVATEAECESGCLKIPAEHHTCGIYSTEDRDTAEEYGHVLGKVYGWGRYVRHDSGWKAQFAYPKCFYLTAEQVELIEPLKKYHVPIYVMQPIRMYDPTEEGYDGPWTEETHGDCRTDQESAPGEAGDSGEDDED